MIRSIVALLLLAILGLLALVWHADPTDVSPTTREPAEARAQRVRRPSERRRRLEPAAGADEATEATIPEAPPLEEPTADRDRPTPVEWLLARQAEDGSWDPEDADRITRTELTATVALYLLALGPSEQHDAALERALEWLAGRMHADDGRVLDPIAGYDRRAHATAALALTEAAAMYPNMKRRLEPERAIAHLVRDVAGEAFQRVGADRTTEVEAATWAAMALCSGSLGGADVRPEQLERARNNLRGFFGNPADVAFDDRSIAMLACADVLLGGNPEHDVRIRRGIDALLERTAEGRLDDPRLAYFGTLATFQVGGAAWGTWRARLDADPRPLDASHENASAHAVATRAMADVIVERWDAMQLDPR